MAELNVLHLYMLLNYFPETGLFQWQERTPDMMAMVGGDTRSMVIKTWNKKHAGKEAGYIDPYDGYRKISIMAYDYKAHHIAWTMTKGFWPEDEIDHVNGNRSDNRFSNLRNVIRLENMKNKKRGSNNKTGVIGVHWNAASKKWAAAISVNRVQYHLGCYETIELAVQVRKAAEIHYGFHINHGRAA
jgi:hypothetical protein